MIFQTTPANVIGPRTAVSPLFGLRATHPRSTISKKTEICVFNDVRDFMYKGAFFGKYSPKLEKRYSFRGTGSRLKVIGRNMNVKLGTRSRF